MKYFFPGLLICLWGVSCTKQNDISTEPKLIFRFKFDSTQTRLNNLGQTSSIPEGNAAQSPVFNKMSAHYIELAQNATTALGQGAVIYLADETEEGGERAIEFSKSVLAGNNEVFYAISLKDIAPGEYEYLRLSLAYQNYSIQFHVDTTINDSVVIRDDYWGTLASFIGYNTYITSYTVKNQAITVDDNRLQGYWGFETTISGEGFSEDITLSGQAPPGTTTVVNPLFSTSPIPEGSCVITAAFVPGKLKITGNEEVNIIVEASLSVNKSFEWREIVENGKWDPLKNEPVVDMGIRGMIPSIRE
ncbi:MAG: hypothetical protein KIT80_05545 [Chitinophagaceae bacterium]|nr:hypothetical protein [Chitinophagaceae bacterium]MCW5926360.1 hypothetical protein [Chitinophagaceae bacterium]